MLNISGMNRFYYIRNFTDMRCKYARILSVIRHQLGRDPERDEVFIVMSGNRSWCVCSRSTGSRRVSTRSGLHRNISS